jgi:mRNA interferase RelE/StbE
MKTVVYQREAIYDLRRHSNRAKLIRSKIEQYAADPATQANNVKKLTGSPLLRLRVGDFRVVFTETDDTISVREIGPRGGIYD